MCERLMIVPLLAVVALAGAMAQDVQPQEFTSDFGLERCEKFVSKGGNDYFRLKPGRTWRYEGEEDGVFVELEIKVLDQTKTITFTLDGQQITAKTRVVRERQKEDGELVEESKNYFACCESCGDVYYFGEKTDIYEDGHVVSHEGSWLAGVNGATPGLAMPQTFLLGARYFQEVAPGTAMDQAKHVEMGLTIQTPAGVFEKCVRVKETSPLEPGVEEFKIYSPDVGLIVDDFLELVEFDP